MTGRKTKLVDSLGRVHATALVADRDGVYEGTVDLHETSPELRALFAEFEEIVNGQMFAFLDDVQFRMSSSVSRAIFDDGCEASLQDLQVFPSTGDISFRLAGVCAAV